MWRFCIVWIVAGTLQMQVNVAVCFIFSQVAHSFDV